MSSTVAHALQSVRDRAVEAGVFGSVEITDGVLRCAAARSAEPAWYLLRLDGSSGTVSLVTADRWLSESIEADLMHTGDPMEELVEEELVELGYEGETPVIRHFRSDDMLYTFESPLPVAGAPDAAEVATQWLLAYEAAFRELGDMEADEEA